MCTHYILAQKIEVLEKRFNVQTLKNLEFEANYNIIPGTPVPVITDDNPGQLQLFTFGLTPFWSKEPMQIVNARSEGDKNKNNNPNYRGSKGIIIKKSFRKPIRSQRCLIIADAYIVGTTKEKLNKPYLVYLRDNKRPFAFAGIWDIWKDNESGEEIKFCCIITTTANNLIQKIPYHRMPVMLKRNYEQHWIRSSIPLTDVTVMLRKYPADEMNAYPILPEIKNPENNNIDFIKPVGERLEKEFDFKSTKELKLQGMGRQKSPSNTTNWSKRMGEQKK